jgi:hypothetical protein
VNAKERVIAALERREPDRVPGGEMAIDFELTEIALGVRPENFQAMLDRTRLRGAYPAHR